MQNGDIIFLKLIDEEKFVFEVSFECWTIIMVFQAIRYVE
jgi:hypothetical protein